MKSLTYREFIELASKNYCKGGEVFVECWDERQYNEYVEMFGAVTEKKAKQMFNRGY